MSCQRAFFALLLVASTLRANGAGAQSVVQECPPDGYVDRTATSADREITWGFSIQSDPERCMRVRVGQSVTFIGSFGAHPLDPEGGDLPSPIAAHTDGRVTFTTAGTFGYVCGFHPQMKGAVHVVPAQAASAVPASGQVASVLLVVALLAVGARAQGRPRQRRATPA